jgi:3-hydroxyisobutyrate dehydrogenase-like beta-hydroxyacid dehydrogenase
MQYGYRFIWLRPDGSLQATRGQARLPSFAAVERLFAAAKAEGWGDQDGDAMT